MSGLQQVLDVVAASDGTTTVDGIAERTGLDPDLVRVALHQLVALGRLGRDGMTLSCPDDGCGGCTSRTSHGCSCWAIRPTTGGSASSATPLCATGMSIPGSSSG